jgi:hypothetical protein
MEIDNTNVNMGIESTKSKIMPTVHIKNAFENYRHHGMYNYLDEQHDIPDLHKP